MKPIETINFKNEQYDENNKKKYKLAILIIASKSNHYDVFTECWKLYMNRLAEVKCFFLYCDENIVTDIEVDDNSITYKCKESYIPGILYKTLAGYFVCNRFLQCDYIIRTNLSSFIYIPTLLSYLENKPRHQYVLSRLELFYIINERYKDKRLNATELKWKKFSNVLQQLNKNVTMMDNGEIKSIDDIMHSNKHSEYLFFGGYFFLFSNDLVNKLLDKIFIDNILSVGNIVDIPDDVAISMIVQLPDFGEIVIEDITSNAIIPNNLIDFNSYSPEKWYIRNRTDYYFENRNVDILNLCNQVYKYYNKSVKQLLENVRL